MHDAHQFLPLIETVDNYMMCKLLPFYYAAVGLPAYGLPATIAALTISSIRIK